MQDSGHEREPGYAGPMKPGGHQEPRVNGPLSRVLPGFVQDDAEFVEDMNLQERTDRAIALLREYEPKDAPYYLAFSGGKDSCVIKELAKMAGVKFDAVYHSTTIDPPELIRFIKKFHADVPWSLPKHGNMMHRVATARKPPPTRNMRWCCSEYKETGGVGRVCIFGVRAAESARRKARWTEFAKHQQTGKIAICPIVFWTDAQLWEFIRSNNVPYCSLYDEGFTRLGCVGCPLAKKSNQAKEFKRWPAFERNWKKAIIANWEFMRTQTRLDGKPYMHSRFKTGEEFWHWWIETKSPDLNRGGCQTGQLWTNEPGVSDEDTDIKPEQGEPT